MIERIKLNIFYIIIILLLVPALFVNIGKLPLTSDEPTRAVVSLEMNLSGNYITPTIHGNYYYRKPPLYNWILAGLFKITHNESEFIVRLPAILSLIGFAITLFFFVKKNLSEKVALIATLMFVTSGRILFYDSQLGLIDLFYSWLTFTGFIVIYHFSQKQKFFLLFILSYFITTLGVLTKGLPSLLFQGITLLFVFVQNRDFKKLFHWAHFLGILLMVAIAGIYFWKYSKYNSPHTYIKSLLFESTQRTPLQHGVWDSLKHLLLFPFLQLYNIAPWSLLFILLLKKGLFKIVIKHPFIKYCLYLFLYNIIIYWISPSTLPRYLFMIYPLLFIFLAQLYHEADMYAPKLKQFLLKILIYSSITITAAGLVIFFFIFPQSSISFILKIGFIIICLATLVYLMLKMAGYRIILFALILFTLRLGFNWFVIPYRYNHSPEPVYRKASFEVARLTKGVKLFVYSFTPLDHTNIFYIEREKRDIVMRTNEPMKKNYYYIIYTNWVNHQQCNIVYNFFSKPDNTPITLVFVK
ncbi:MAG: glycosyltransferase family 39 protein [Bacteroidales bacterium]|nr:glycosyltransferase family 39 protein [Bacteroidales bacterium]